MASQNDIDAVLQEAQQAVDSLARDAAALANSSPLPTPVAAAPGQPAASATTVPPDRLQRLLHLRVSVVVRLAERTLPTHEVIKLAPGSIVEFDRTVDRPLDLLVNNRQIGSGVAVKIAEHYGIRVSSIGDVMQRINSLARSA